MIRRQPAVVARLALKGRFVVSLNVVNHWNTASDSVVLATSTFCFDKCLYLFMENVVLDTLPTLRFVCAEKCLLLFKGHLLW